MSLSYLLMWIHCQFCYTTATLTAVKSPPGIFLKDCGELIVCFSQNSELESLRDHGQQIAGTFYFSVLNFQTFQSIFLFLSFIELQNYLLSGICRFSTNYYIDLHYYAYYPCRRWWCRRIQDLFCLISCLVFTFDLDMNLMIILSGEPTTKILWISLQYMLVIIRASSCTYFKLKLAIHSTNPHPPSDQEKRSSEQKI